MITTRITKHGDNKPSKSSKRIDERLYYNYAICQECGYKQKVVPVDGKVEVVCRQCSCRYEAIVEFDKDGNNIFYKEDSNG